MRIVVLTQYFPPDSGWIADDIANELSDRGHDVRVLTTYPHYRTGRVAEGYKQKLHHIEYHGTIPVRRVPIFPSHSRNPIGRIANYLSFAWSARFAKSFVRHANVVFVHGTPATVAAPAHGWSKSLGVPFVYHVQDIWPESVTESGFLPNPLAKLAEPLINRWLAKVYSSAAAVNAIAPTAQELLIERGVPHNRCHLVFNWSREGGVDVDRGRDRHPGLTLVYAGNLGRFQDLGTVIRAAGKLSHLDGFRLLIAGAGTEMNALKNLVTELRAEDTIQFMGHLDQNQMNALYMNADFQVVPLKDLEFFAGTIPSKFQAGLARGLPLITTVKGDVTRLVSEHNLGFTALPEDVESLVDAFQKAYESSSDERIAFSQRAIDFYESYLSRTKAMDRIESILETAAASSSSAT